MANHATKLFIILAVFLLISGFARATELQLNRNMMASLIEGRQSVDRALISLSMMGARDEDLVEIRSFLKTKIETKDDIISLNNKNQLLINGKFTGYSIESYQPLQLKYKGKLWQYNKFESLSKNYFNLIGLSRKDQSVSLQNLFLNKAYALTMKRGAEIGITIGYAVGAVLGIISGVSLTVGTAGAAAPTILFEVWMFGNSLALWGAGIGALVGGSVELYDMLRAKIKGVKLQCSEKDINLKIKDQTINIVRTANPPGIEVNIFDKDGVKLSSVPSEPKELRQMWQMLADGCHNSDDAKNILSDITSAVDRIPSLDQEMLKQAPNSQLMHN